MSEPKLLHNTCPQCGGKLHIKKERFFTISTCSSCAIRLVRVDNRAKANVKSNILSVDKKEHTVWVGIDLGRAANDNDKETLEIALGDYGIKYEYIFTTPSGKLGKTFDRISIALPYPAYVFELQEKYKIFKSAKSAIELIITGTKGDFQAKRLFCGDLAITQLYQQQDEVVNAG